MNIYASNNWLSNYMKQKLVELKEEIYNYSWTYNNHNSVTDRASRLKINKDIE